MKTFKEFLSEDAPANAMGSAGISGAGNAINQGIAGYDKMLAGAPLRRRPPAMFGGRAVFKVPSDRYLKSLRGKLPYKHHKSYVGRDEIGEEILAYIRENPNEPVILEDEKTGAMVYLRHGKRK